ncbi:MAG: DNA utilization protein GntX [Morganella sp. (in: enterobacteria)]
MVIIENYCLLCKQPLAIAAHGICGFCERGLPVMPRVCLRCGHQLITPEPECGRCLHSPPPWQRLLAVTGYQPPLTILIHRLKYAGQPFIARALARLLLCRFLQGYRDGHYLKPDLLLSSPLHRHKQWLRGFNQSDLITHPLAKWLRRPYDSSGVIRTRATLSQRTLSRAHRLTNLKSAFVLTREIRGLNIAVTDDVITTGATMTALSELLIRAGAATVQVWCLCRTL